LYIVYTIKEEVTIPLQSIEQTASSLIAAAVISFIYLAVSVFAFVAAYPMCYLFFLLWNAACRRNKITFAFESKLMLIAGLLVSLMICAKLLSINFDQTTIPNLITVAAIGVVGFVAFAVKATSPKNLKFNITAFVVMSFLILIQGGLIFRMIDLTMESLGLRSRSEDTVMISESASALIDDISVFHGLNIPYCKTLGGNRFYSSAVVVWAGLGGPASVRFFDGDNAELSAILQIPEDGVMIVKPSKMLQHRSTTCPRSG
jgi:hypothetical protein